MRLRGMRLESPLDDLERAVVTLWRASGRSTGTIHGYLIWVRKYRRHCTERGLQELDGLTLRGSQEFALSYARGRRCKKNLAIEGSRSALCAWAIGLLQLGKAVPEWTISLPKPAPAPIIAQFVEYRRLHAGVAAATINFEIKAASSFMRFLDRRARLLVHTRLLDVDDFVRRLSTRMTPKSIAGWCSALRAFFRFLQSIGKMRFDLASGIVSPKVVTADRPPKTLTFEEVRQLLGAVDRRHSSGRRAFALLLLMISYGLGAAEVSALDLDDIDWRARTIQIRRPKTKTLTLLPLSPAVAKALTAYLRRGRSLNTTYRAIFVRRAMPHERMSRSAVRHCVRDHAKVAGVRGRCVGAHVLRHYAARARRQSLLPTNDNYFSRS